MDFLLFRVIPVILVIMLTSLSPHDEELTWETVVASSFMLIIIISLTTFDYSNKPDEDEADTEKQENNK